MFFNLLRLLFIFVWIRRLFRLVTLPFRAVRGMVSDFGKFFRFIVRLFTPSFWSSLYSSVLEQDLAALGLKIVLAVVSLVLGVGMLLLVVAAIHHAGSTRGGEAASVSPSPADGIGKSDGKPPEVRRAIAVPARGLPVSSPLLRTTYIVAGVADGDYLNVHSGPGMNNKVVARLVNGSGGVQIVGPTVMNGPTPWVQIRFGERTGWVTRSFLKPE